MKNYRLTTKSLLNKQNRYLSQLEDGLCPSKRRKAKKAYNAVQEELKKRDGMNFHTAHKTRTVQEEK